MSNRSVHARPACLALVLGLAAFSYALATANRGTDAASGPAAAGRAVSTNLNFSNPFVDPTRLSTLDRDLGDAVAGSAVVRHICAIGGVRPYTFTAGTLAAFSSNTLQLETQGFFHTPASGTTFGNLATGLPSLFRFSVTVTDSNGSITSNGNPGVSITEPYRLNILTGQNQFRFAMSKLSDAFQYQSYVDNLDTINGKTANGTRSFSVVGAVTAGGKSFTNLDAIGLHLSPDGTVVGNPLISGVVSFTARCTDASGANARSRDGVSQDQVITFNVTATRVLSNTVVCSSVTVKGDTTSSSKGNKDSISFSGIVNTLGKTPTGTVTFRLNDYSIAVPILAKGKISNGAKTGVKANGSVTNKGLFKLTISNESFASNGLLAGKTGTTVNAVPAQLNAMIEVSISDTTTTPQPTTFVDGAQALDLVGKPGRGTKFSTAYKLGSFPKGGPNNPTLAGVFIVTSVRGTDDTKSGTNRDKWQVGFMAVPQNGQATNTTSDVTFNQAATAQLSIGAFTDAAKPAVTASKGNIKLGLKVDAKTPNALVKLQMSEKGKGTYTSGGVDTAVSKIPLAATASANGFNFATNITLFDSASKVLFGGDGSSAIFPKRTQWTSVPSNR